ncbi:MAG: TrkH family potassium uptake protein [Wolbachia endosymbiont of Meromenopon meropis]|nr:TrkH family potassium uptake protein [Wolbachia endosymbiont of Meromenopon meropis]
MKNYQHFQTLRSIAFIIGAFLLVFSLTMIVPAIINKYLKYEWKNFLTGFVITCTSGAILVFLGKLSKLCGMRVIFIMTGSAWIALSLFAAIPFYLNNLNYADALFEAISGFTTTGATIFSNVEKLSPGILLWRVILHSIGGFGIIATGITVLPTLRILSLNNLLHSECSNATKRKLPNTQNAVIHAAIIYYGLILLCILSYYLVGMSLFDAICHGMSSVSTGGFANYNDSIGHYDDPLLEVITIIFMIFGSLPFFSYSRIKSFSDIYRDEQISYFALIVIISFLLAYFWLHKSVNLETSLSFRYSIFIVVSFITSTGYIVCNYIDWGFISVLAFFLTFIGGCGGSASGGIKIFRLVIFLKFVRNRFCLLLNSHTNHQMKYNGKILEDDEINFVFMFFAIYMLIFVISSMIISYLGSTDLITSISAVSATLTNSGPGFSNLIGPSGNYSHFSSEIKLFLSFLMLLGRLEILPIYFCIENLFLFHKK